MRTRAEIESILIRDVRLATLAQKSAYAHLKDVTSDVPSGIPSPDGTVRIRQAGEMHRASLSALSAALERFNEFAANGTVPEDLKD